VLRHQVIVPRSIKRLQTAKIQSRPWCWTIIMLKSKTIAIGAVLLGAVLAGTLVWNWIRTPSTFALSHSESADIFKPRLRLLTPGVLSIALGSRNTRATSLALQKDGTIVVGATSWPKVGTPPASEKARGVVLLLAPNGLLLRPAVTLLADTPSFVTSVATGHDGTIAVVGYGSAAEEGPGGAGNRHFLVARLLPDGVPDRAFGGSGVVLAKMRSSIWIGDAGHAVAIQGDDRIVTTGGAGYALAPLAHGSYCATARFTRDGRFDRRFGDNGRVLALVPGNTLCGSTSVLAAPDGKVIAVGTYHSERTPYHIAIFRHLPDGTLDRQFGRGGIAELLKISAASGGGAALDSQGRIVVVARELLSPTRTRMLIARFDTDGNLDQSFGSKGIVSLHESTISQGLSAVALQQDGKIVAVGTFGWHSGTRFARPGKRDRIVVVRLDANGPLDKSFSGGGLLIVASPQYLWGATGIAIQPDGKLLIVGYNLEQPNATTSIVIARLNPDGTPDADFGGGH
jgi:uncharacterized delta-60 repeat protein